VVVVVAMFNIAPSWGEAEGKRSMGQRLHALLHKLMRPRSDRRPPNTSSRVWKGCGCGNQNRRCCKGVTVSYTARGILWVKKRTKGLNQYERWLHQNGVCLVLLWFEDSCWVTTLHLVVQGAGCWG